jgi:predicted HD phosphohydrolase
MEHVTFTEMKHGTKADYDLLVRRHKANAEGVADRVLAMLNEMDAMETGYRIDRRRHALQSATRAWRDGADADWVVAALLHDLGDHLAPFSDGHLPASILRPFTREQCSWTVAHHTTFQTIYYAHLIGGDPKARDVHRDSPYFDDCVDFCERWDQCSFDPDYDEEPMSVFEPMLRAVFARRPNDPAVLRPGAREPLMDTDRARARKAA